MKNLLSSQCPLVFCPLGVSVIDQAGNLFNIPIGSLAHAD
jgi:hypothetical protein